jgi:hypothetical protein
MGNTSPFYIKEYFVCDKKTRDSVSGRLQCSCGCGGFLVLREKRAQSQESKTAEKEINEFIEYHKKRLDFKVGNGNTISTSGFADKAVVTFMSGLKKIFSFDITVLNKKFMSVEIIPTLILAVCTRCNRTIEVFNSSKHGYDGCMSENKVNYEGIKNKKIPKCNQCAHEEQRISIEYHYSDLNGIRVAIQNEKELTNAFDWITVHLECANCKKARKNYLDLETM